MPFDLTTIDAVKSLRSLLKPKGVLITNLTPKEGVNLTLLKVEYKAYLQVFKQILVFTISHKRPAKDRVIFLALNQNKSYSKRDLINFAQKKEKPTRHLRLISNFWGKCIKTENLPILKDQRIPTYESRIIELSKKGK